MYIMGGDSNLSAIFNFTQVETTLCRKIKDGAMSVLILKCFRCKSESLCTDTISKHISKLAARGHFRKSVGQWPTVIFLSKYHINVHVHIFITVKYIYLLVCFGENRCITSVADQTIFHWVELFFTCIRFVKLCTLVDFMSLN